MLSIEQWLNAKRGAVLISKEDFRIGMGFIKTRTPNLKYVMWVFN